MSHLIQAFDANEAWSKALNLLLTSPAATTMESRSGPTTELLHVAITIKDPRQRWVFARQPAINPAFALAEAVWIACGRNDAEVLNFLNRDLSKYSGEGHVFYGAYGYRLRHQHGIDQLESAYRSLANNPTTRQIVLQIWDAKADLPTEDGQPRAQDIPCNTQSILRIQNNKLHWLQTMRSNDIFRGLPYNFVQFTTLHEIVAGWLGLEMGEYTHVVNCLHFYHSDSDNLQIPNAISPISNSDSLMCAKVDSDKYFLELSGLLSDSLFGPQRVGELAHRIDQIRLPISYSNIGNVLLAEAARRHGRFDWAHERLSRVTNPCLRSLMTEYFGRFSKLV